MVKFEPMKIKTKLSQHRRDFWAIYECQECGYESGNQSGYDDEYFHKKVIPSMICPKCGKKAPENYKPIPTKYPNDLQI